MAEAEQIPMKKSVNQHQQHHVYNELQASSLQSSLEAWTRNIKRYLVYHINSSETPLNKRDTTTIYQLVA